MPNKVAIALLLLLAVVVRAWDFPHVAQQTAEERAVAPRVRLFVATNHALWNAYAGMAQTRCVWVLVTLPMVLRAIVEAFKLGVYATGTPTIAIAGGSGGPDARLPDGGLLIDGPPIAAESSASPTIVKPPVGEPTIAALGRPATPAQEQPAAADDAAAAETASSSATTRPVTKPAAITATTPSAL